MTDVSINVKTSIVLFLALGIVSLFGHTTEDILTQMDQASVKFTSMTADMSRTTYTKVIDDKSTELGLIRVKKHAAKDLQIYIDFTSPDPKTAALRGRKVEIYYPKLKTVQEIDLGKHGSLVDQFLLVGFGTAGSELLANYTVKYTGDELVSGQKTRKLELLPKASEAKEKLRRMELWLSEDGSYPVQQKFLMPSGDYYVANYTNVKLNQPMTEESVKLKLPKGVKRERPQK